MSTVGETISLALKDAGVTGAGQTASGDDVKDAMTTLADMLALWQIDNLMVYAQQVLTLPLTGAQSYTIGVGGTLSTDRPAKIDFAVWRDATGRETNLDVLAALQDYQQIAYKAQGGQPAAIHYEPSYPLGVLSLWPAGAVGSLKLLARVQLSAATELTADLVIPPEYREAVRYSLAERLTTTFQTPLRPDIAALARSARKLIKRNNVVIPRSQMPAHLVAGRRCVWAG